MKRAVVVLLLVAACGGGSGDKAVSAKAAYLARAEAVCAEANAELATAKKERPTAVAAVPAYVHRIVEIARTNVTQLSALSPPRADAAELSSKLLTPLAAQLEDADAYDARVAAAARAKDQAALFQLVTKPPTTTRVDLGFMRSYGFRACVTAADTASASK